MPGAPWPHKDAVAAVAFAREHHLGGDVVASIAYDGYALFHLWPDVRVLVDGRNETVHPRALIRDPPTAPTPMTSCGTWSGSQRALNQRRGSRKPPS